MPTALLADDEDLPRAELRRMLAKAWPELQVVAECEHGAAAIEALAAQQPDVAFLDIRMPGASGLEVARAASGHCHVVFTTAYDSHAIEAFEAGAVDYLLKPIQADRLQQAVARLRERLASARPAATLDSLLAHLADNFRQRDAQAQGGPERLRWISASVGDVIKPFGIDDVLFFQSDEKYTRVVTNDSETLIRKPIRELLDELDPEKFWQVHRATIVNVDFIAAVRRGLKDQAEIALKGHRETLLVSRNFTHLFFKMLGKGEATHFAVTNFVPS